MVSADTSISCIQPTQTFYKSLKHNRLQKPSVGRHHTNLHSADTINRHPYPTPFLDTLNRHPYPTNYVTYLSTHPKHLYCHQIHRFPTKTIQRLLYLQRCGPWSIPPRATKDQQGPRSDTRPDRESENGNNKTTIKL